MAHQQFEAEVVFDSMKYGEGKYGPYYSMCLSLPPGAPGTDYVKQYDRHQAYISCNPDTPEQAYLSTLGRGDKLTVLYDSRKGGKYYPILPDNFASAAPARGTRTQQPETQTRTYAAPQPRAQGGTGLLTDDDHEAWCYAIDEIVPILAYAHSTVAGDTVLSELGEEAQQKYAVTAFLYGKDRYRHIDPTAIRLDEEDSEGETVDVEKIIYGVQKESLPQGLLVAIAAASHYIESPTMAAEYLKVFNLSSADIDPNDKATWMRMFEIANSYALLKENIPSEEARMAVVNQYKLEDIPF